MDKIVTYGNKPSIRISRQSVKIHWRPPIFDRKSRYGKDYLSAQSSGELSQKDDRCRPPTNVAAINARGVTIHSFS